jgi:hypothetical protein
LRDIWVRGQCFHRSDLDYLLISIKYDHETERYNPARNEGPFDARVINRKRWAVVVIPANGKIANNWFLIATRAAWEHSWIRLGTSASVDGE